MFDELGHFARKGESRGTLQVIFKGMLTVPRSEIALTELVGLFVRNRFY